MTILFRKIIKLFCLKPIFFFKLPTDLYKTRLVFEDVANSCFLRVKGQQNKASHPNFVKPVYLLDLMVSKESGIANE